MKFFGYCLAGTGVALVLFGLFGVEVSVEVSLPNSFLSDSLGNQESNRVANVHGMHLQSLFVLSGVGAIIGGIVAIGFGIIEQQLNTLSEIIDGSRPMRSDGASASLTEPSSSNAESDASDKRASAMSLAEAQEQYGILQEGEVFRYKNYRYEKLEDAVAYAKKQV